MSSAPSRSVSPSAAAGIGISVWLDDPARITERAERSQEAKAAHA
jgi:hypothetical protein